MCPFHSLFIRQINVNSGQCKSVDAILAQSGFCRTVPAECSFGRDDIARGFAPHIASGFALMLLRVARGPTR